MTGNAQIQRQSAVLKTLQTAFEMPVVIDRLPRHQLHAASGEAGKIRRLHQLPIQTRRRNFQRVRSRYYVFDVEDRAKLSAEVRAIFVRNSGHRIASCRGLVEKHAQHASLASTQVLDVEDLESAGGCDPVRDSPHAIDVKRHESNNLLADGCNTDGAYQLKSGLAPTGVLRQKPVHSSSQLLNIRPFGGKRQTQGQPIVEDFEPLTSADNT